MPLIHADSCSVCHKRKTQHPSGICSRCRRLKGSTSCKVCGKISTTHSSGVCYKCRKSMKGPEDEFAVERINQAIEDTKVTLFILERRKENETFGKIAEMCGLSKSACYSRFVRACGRDTSTGGIDITDGTYVPSQKEEKE